MISLIPTKVGTGANISMVHDTTGLMAYGKVILLKKSDCIVLVSYGEKAGQKIRMPLSFPVTVDGITYVADEPEVPAVEGKAKRAPRAKLAEGQKTKIQQCREILMAMDPLTWTKAAAVERFIKEAGCTPAGANTYYITLMKE